MATKPVVAPVKKVIYLNNRDLLKQIHLSKNTYCSFLDPVKDHQYDIILPSLSKINQRTVAEARRNRADRIKKETKVIVDPTNIPNSEVVFRISCWEHIPIAPKKIPKSATKKKKIEDIFDLELVDEEDILDLIVPEPIDDTAKKYLRLPFPPFYHFRLDENKQPYLVGKSHWKGDLETGEFCKDHGTMTHILATMFIKLCDRYATRSNWRGYTYNEEMRGAALVQLTQVGLRFDEFKSQNPFAYYTATITNSFTHILNSEKKNQNIRDDLLEQNGLTPSWSRQNSGRKEAHAHGPVINISVDEYNQD